jgi:hypothetical protein
MSTIEKVSITKIKRALFVDDLIDQPIDGVHFIVFNEGNSQGLASNRFLDSRKCENECSVADVLCWPPGET